MFSHASWIWLDSDERRPRNQSIIARTTVELPEFTAATLAITVDSRYRLYINGQWVEDGPCRCWPQHYQYDVHDVAALLRPGKNVIAVVARYFGVSTFHHVVQEAGLLAELTVATAAGETLTFGTDAGWKVRESPAHLRDTARVSIQMELMEWYDATHELAGATGTAYDDSHWPAARVLYAADAGPWQDLHPRDVRFLTREPIFPRHLVEANVVSDLPQVFTFDMKTLCYPEDTSANNAPMAGILATVLIAEQAQEVPVVLDNGAVSLTCNGVAVTDGLLRLRKGDNLLVLSLYALYGHGSYDFSLGFRAWNGLDARNPCDAVDPNPWAWVGPFGTMAPVTNMLNWRQFSIPEDVKARLAEVAAADDAKTFCRLAGSDYHHVPANVMLLRDSFLPFLTRQVRGSAEALLEQPSAFLADNQEWTTVRPTPDGDVELCVDLGKEVVGWVEFELDAPAGTVVDTHLIEYRMGDDLQLSYGNRNGFRYITKAGVNRYVSFKRRAGRYLFLTLRQMTAPVRLRTVRLLLATYPVDLRGDFRCSDAALNEIWRISAYTERLCMEDTYTDCPLYEQTLWVGDARNESLYNAICYGADDITLRCLRLTAQSLDTMPMVGSQVPSGWDALLSAWSFLWGINVWEYYFTSGDRAGLAELYPAVMQNLRAARACCTDRGLFSSPAWNLFDWAPIDQEHDTVLHNALFLIGAIDAARHCCAVLGEADGPWLDDFRQRLAAATIASWDAEKGSYPDAIREDGTISPSTSQHTSALALIYDVLPEGTRAVARRNIVDPPAGMVRVGSPFALQFFLEALEAIGDAASALAIVRAKWQDMLDCGATTCWETFRGWESQFPTRSHCHAWSAAPIYVFSRLLLGVVPVAPAAAEVVVSPHPLGLTWADGAVASPRGDLKVAWRVEDTTLNFTIDMPAGVTWRIEPNADWHGITRVVVNGEEVPLAISCS